MTLFGFVAPQKIYDALIPYAQINPAANADRLTCDGNANTYDNVFSGWIGKWTFTNGSRKVARCNIIMSTTPDVLSGHAYFYYIPKGETNPANYVRFYTYTYTGGGMTKQQINAEMPGDWVDCDGIYILFDHVGEGPTQFWEINITETRYDG